jgi:hypothetical protein
MNVDFKFAIGPVWTGWGMTNHSLLLAADEIVDCPYPTAAALRLGFALQLPFIADPETVRRERAVSGDVERSELEALGAKRYPLREIRELRVECRWMQNAIVLGIQNLANVVYRLHNRQQTESCRVALRQMYPDLYRERGFAESSIGRLLKS